MDYEVDCPRCGSTSAKVFYRDTITKEILCCSECAERVYSEYVQQEQEEQDFWDYVDSEVDRILEKRKGI